MTTDKGPILRKRGQSAPEPAAPSSPPPTPPAESPRPAPRPAGRPGFGRSAEPPPRGEARRESPPPAASPGRRLYDPRAERGSGPGPAPSGSPRSGRRPLGSGRPLARDEKSELKTEAQKLAKEKGIPLVHAYRILKGQTTLNDVLKGMMRKERFEQLVSREGVDRELAGQVASGHLPKSRAVLLTRMRTLRKQKLHVDGIKAAEAEKKRVGLDIFGRGWVLGRVRVARPYDFDFLADGAEKSEKLFKHDVKAVCAAEDFDAAKAACTAEPSIQAEGLASTEDRSQRVRPSDDLMLKLIDEDQITRFTMRDGEVIVGMLRSFGRWDAEILLKTGETITIFFHGLHASAANLGQPS
jgi:hypothetical protein